MNRKRIERALGRFLFVFASKLPESTSPVNFGAKRFRALCGRLIMKSCGENVNIEKGTFFASDTSLGNKSGIGAFRRKAKRCRRKAQEDSEISLCFS